MKPRISVISVNYNGFALTAAMIDSLRRHVTTPLEIVVVDNGSQRDEATELQERYPEIIAIRSPENLGFAGGNNLGIRAASGDRLLLLNNDTEVGDDTLHYLAETLDADPSVGAVCPKIRFWAPPQAIQFAGYTPLTRITLRNALVGFGQPDDGSRDTPHTTPYAHGAAMMVRREAGYRIVYDPRATVFHKESATTGRQSPLRSYYLTRNRLLFARRNRRGTERRLSILYQLGVALPKSVAAALLCGRRDLAAAVLRGGRDFLRHKTGKE